MEIHGQTRTKFRRPEDPVNEVRQAIAKLDKGSPTLIVDGDVIAHLAATLNTYKDEEEDEGFYFDDVGARITALTIINSVMHKTWTSQAIICLSSSTSFRKEVCKGYKANRKPGIHAELLPVAKAALSKAFVTFEIEGFEGDDLCAMVYDELRHSCDTWVCTIDKDLKQIPCFQVNPKTLETFHVQQREASDLLWLQTLTGDSCDEYYGLPDIGPVAAYDILDTADKLHSTLRNPELTYDDIVWYLIVDAYEENYMTEEDAIATASVALIGYNRDKPRLITEDELW